MKARILHNSLEELMKTLVPEQQTGFIKESLIRERILNLVEITDKSRV